MAPQLRSRKLKDKDASNHESNANQAKRSRKRPHIPIDDERPSTSSKKRRANKPNTKRMRKSNEDDVPDEPILIDVSFESSQPQNQDNEDASNHESVANQAKRFQKTLAQNRSNVDNISQIKPKKELQIVLKRLSIEELKKYGINVSSNAKSSTSSKKRRANKPSAKRMRKSNEDDVPDEPILIDVSFESSQPQNQDNEDASNHESVANQELQIVLKRLSIEELKKYGINIPLLKPVTIDMNQKPNTRKRKRNEHDVQLAQMSSKNSSADSQRKTKGAGKSSKLQQMKNSPNNDGNAERHIATNKDLYNVLEVERDAQLQKIKANYYRLARIHHPDRVNDAEKANAMEKFSILHQAYSILSNSDMKSRYDAGDNNVLFEKTNPNEKWMHHIRIVNSNDIECARRKYQGSYAEESDIIRELAIGKGSIRHLFNVIPFMRVEDEPRIIQMAKRSIEEGKLQKMLIKKM